MNSAILPSDWSDVMEDTFPLFFLNSFVFSISPYVKLITREGYTVNDWSLLNDTVEVF